MLEIQQDRKGKYRFLIKNAEGRPLMESISFDNAEAARSALDSLKSRIGHPASFERTTNHEGRFQFALKDAKGKVVGESQYYSSEAGMENGITHIRERIAGEPLKP